MTNPWGITRRQGETLDVLGRVGSSKAAAKVMGVSFRTVERQLLLAKTKMAADHTIQAVLLWDREQRAADDAKRF